GASAQRHVSNAHVPLCVVCNWIGRTEAWRTARVEEFDRSIDESNPRDRGDSDLVLEPDRFARRFDLVQVLDAIVGDATECMNTWLNVGVDGDPFRPLDRRWCEGRRPDFDRNAVGLHEDDAFSGARNAKGG